MSQKPGNLNPPICIYLQKMAKVPRFKLKQFECTLSLFERVKERVERMRSQGLGPKADFMRAKVKYGVAISRGQCVCLSMSGTEDGLTVVLPSSSAAKAHALFYGIVDSSGEIGAVKESLLFGYCAYAQYTKATRSATSVGWASGASIASLVALQIETIANGLQSVGGTQAASAFLPVAILLEDIASWAGSATATSDTGTALTSGVKVFLRAM